jgi:hypothetical protein
MFPSLLLEGKCKRSVSRRNPVGLESRPRVEVASRTVG